MGFPLNIHESDGYVQFEDGEKSLQCDFLFCVEEHHRPTVSFICFSLLISGSLFHIACHLLKMLGFRDDKKLLTEMLSFDLGIIIAA